MRELLSNYSSEMFPFGDVVGLDLRLHYIEFTHASFR